MGFNYYTAEKDYGELFYKLPKALMHGGHYRQTSLTAKLAYVYLAERLQISVRNHWVDAQNRVYLIYPSTELAVALGCSIKTVVRAKKELESVGLLKQVRLGFNHQTGCNEPNRLYLGSLDVKPTDVYVRQQALAWPDLENEQLTTPVQVAAGQDLRGSEAMPSQQKSPVTVTTTGMVKGALEKEEELKDKELRYQLDTVKLDFAAANYSSAQRQAQASNLVQHADEFLADQRLQAVGLDVQSLNLLQLWCQTPEQLSRIIGIILGAKKQVEQQYATYGVHFILEDDELQVVLRLTLQRYFNAIRREDKIIKNYSGYLFSTLTNMFSNFWNTQQRAKTGVDSMPEIDLLDMFEG